MHETIIMIVQLLCYFIVYVPFRLLLGLKSRCLLRQAPKRAILAANHQSKLDPFMACSAVPLRVFVRLIPIYFPTTHIYMDRWWKRALLSCLGCIPVNKGRKENIRAFINLERRHMIGRTLFIFPEGKIATRASAPKNGVAYMALRNNSSIIPVKIMGAHKLRAFSSKVNVTIGNPLAVPKNEKGRYDKIAENIVRGIYGV